MSDDWYEEAIKRKLAGVADLYRLDVTRDQILAKFSQAAGRPVSPDEKVLDVLAEIDAKWKSAT